MRPVLTVVVALGLALALAGDELVQSGGPLENPSFDVSQDGRPVGWSVNGGTVESVSQPVAEPGLAARLSADQTMNAAHLTQLLSLQRGVTYRLSARILINDARVQLLRLQLGWAEANGSPRTRTAEISNTGSAYQLVTVPVTTIPCDSTGSLASVVLLRHSTGAIAFIDDVRLEQVGQTPCPTSTSPPTIPPPTNPPVPTTRPGQPPSASATPRPGETAAPGIGPLRNGGFEQIEDGTLVAWRDHGGVLSRVAGPVYGGSFAGAFFSSSDSTKWAYQTVAASGLSWYEFAAHVRSNGPGVEQAFLRVSWYRSSDGSGSAVDSVDSTAVIDAAGSGYRRLTTGSVQAPPGVRSANVRILLRPRSSSGATIFIDNASWRPAAPAPGGSAEEQAIVSSGGSTSGASDDAPYWSGVAGVSRGPVNALGTPYATPVIVRSDQLAASAPERDGSGSRWMWLLAASGVVIVGGGAWWGWRRRRIAAER